MLLAGVTLVPATGVLIGVALPIGDSQAAAALPLDPTAVLDARSPGARPDGALFQTKPRLASVARPGLRTPSERVLSAVRQRPEEPAFVPAPAGVPDTVVGDLLPADEGAVPDSGVPETASFVPSGGIPGLVGVGGGGPGGGGSGGGGGGGPGGGDTGGGPTTGTTPETPAAPVPEPATWLSMLLGFGLLGAALRQGRGMSRRLVTAGSRCHA